MTYQVVIERRAEREIDRQAGWIEERSNSPDVAARWVNSILAHIATLSVFPLRCPVDPKFTVFGEETRVLLFGKRNQIFRILFYLDGETVRVVSVRHAAQSGPIDAEETDDPY